MPCDVTCSYAILIVVALACADWYVYTLHGCEDGSGEANQAPRRAAELQSPTSSSLSTLPSAVLLTLAAAMQEINSLGMFM